MERDEIILFRVSVVLNCHCSTNLAVKTFDSPTEIEGLTSSKRMVEALIVKCVFGVVCPHCLKKKER